MKERPILFSGPMVRAVLDGRKTMTRRVVDPDLAGMLEDGCASCEQVIETDATPMGGLPAMRFCPYGLPGDHLWVRETFAFCDNCGHLNFAATVNRPRNCLACDDFIGPWKPSIFMPRAESRITLGLVDVRVERLQEISEDDARAEGAEPYNGRLGLTLPSGAVDVDSGPYREGFALLWNGLNERRGFPWKRNPWVWVMVFKAVASADQAPALAKETP